jgi:hypothetical protein
LPYTLNKFSKCLLVCATQVSLLSLLGASPAPSTDQVHILWRTPPKDSQFNAESSVQHNVTFLMSGILRTMAGHRADPVYVVEDRTRTYIMHTASEIYVSDVFARHHGGPNNTDTTVKRRSRKQIVPFDASGRYGYEPFLCKGEPPLDDAHANWTEFKACPADEPSGDHAYEDPGDAVLSQLPAGQVEIGQTWTFSRPVVVGREEGSGTLDYVDTLQRIDERGSHRIAVIDVTAAGRINPNNDLKTKGFHTSTMTFSGTAEFDLGQGTPGVQHYTGHVEFHASIMGANIGYAIDEVYDGKPWTISAKQ